MQTTPLAIHISTEQYSSSFITITDLSLPSLHCDVFISYCEKLFFHKITEELKIQGIRAWRDPFQESPHLLAQASSLPMGIINDKISRCKVYVPVVSKKYRSLFGFDLAIALCKGKKIIPIYWGSDVAPYDIQIMLEGIPLEKFDPAGNHDDQIQHISERIKKALIDDKGESLRVNHRYSYQDN